MDLRRIDLLHARSNSTKHGESASFRRDKLGDSQRRHPPYPLYLYRHWKNGEWETSAEQTANMQLEGATHKKSPSSLSSSYMPDKHTEYAPVVGDP